MVKALVSCVITGSALVLALCIGESIMDLMVDLFPGIGQRIGLVPENDDKDRDNREKESRS